MRAVNSGSARSIEQIVLKTEKAKYCASWNCPLRSLQKADVLGHQLVAMVVLTESLEFLAQ